MPPSFCSRIQDCILFLRNEIDLCVAFIALFCMWCKTMFSNKQDRTIGVFDWSENMEDKKWKRENMRDFRWEECLVGVIWGERENGGAWLFSPQKKKFFERKWGEKMLAHQFFSLFFFLSFYGLFAKCLACLFYSFFFSLIKYLYKKKKLHDRDIRVKLYKFYFSSLHFSILQPNPNKEN